MSLDLPRCAAALVALFLVACTAAEDPDVAAQPQADADADVGAGLPDLTETTAGLPLDADAEAMLPDVQEVPDIESWPDESAYNYMEVDTTVCKAGTCKPCESAQDEFEAAVHSVLSTATACVAHADCTAIHLADLCDSQCGYAVALAQAVTVAAALEAIDQGLCGGANWGGCNVPCWTGAGGNVACIEGKCLPVSTCDPKYVKSGAACNDDNPCTTDDVCFAADQCKGKPLACDDGNACTADACQGGKCVHDPVTGSCPTASACSLGATCVAGQCQDSNVLGWKKQLPDKAYSAGGAVARVPGGGFVVATTSTTGGPRVVRIDAAGAILWKIMTLPGKDAYVTDVTVADDGEVAIAGFVRAQGDNFGKDAFLTRLDAQGQTLGTTVVPVAGAEAVRVATRPKTQADPGGYALVASRRLALDDWHAWTGRLGPQGQFLGQTELGPAPGGAGTFVAARADSVALVTPTPAKPTPSSGAETDLRFVRFDATGGIAVDVTLASPGGDQPLGLVALPDGGWFAVAREIQPGQGAAATMGQRLRFDDAGKVVWQNTETFLPTAAALDGGTVLVTAETFKPALVHVRHFDTSGALLGSLALPPSVSPGLKWMAPGGDGGVLLGSAYNGFANLVRVFGACPGGGCPTPGCP